MAAGTALVKAGRAAVVAKGLSWVDMEVEREEVERVAATVEMEGWMVGKVLWADQEVPLVVRVAAWAEERAVAAMAAAMAVARAAAMAVVETAAARVAVVTEEVRVVATREAVVRVAAKAMAAREAVVRAEVGMAPVESSEVALWAADRRALGLEAAGGEGRLGRVVGVAATVARLEASMVILAD